MKNKNIGQYILEKQNEPYQIDRLLAQRAMYSKAKYLNNIVILLTIIIPFVIKIIEYILGNQWDNITILYSIALIVVIPCIVNYIDKLKKRAGNIQELFDVEVLQLSSNEYIDTLHIDDSVIKKYSKKAAKNDEKRKEVKDWYMVENLKDINSNLASLLCQITNISYDKEVKKDYIRIIWGGFIVLVSIYIFICIGLTANINIVSIIPALIPFQVILSFLIRETQLSNNSIDDMLVIQKIIDELLTDKNTNDTIDIFQLRRIQDKIYNNRINGPLIPDFIYKIKREDIEENIKYQIDNKINKILENTSKNELVNN